MDLSEGKIKHYHQNLSKKGDTPAKPETHHWLLLRTRLLILSI